MRPLDSNFYLRPAAASDVAQMAELVNYAGEGMPLHLWSKMAEPGEDPWAVGRERAARESGGFSYRNTTVCELDGQLVAALVGYRICPEPEPITTDMPPMLVPLQELENLVPRTWYVNVLASYPDYRGKGIGLSLLEAAESHAVANDCPGLSLIVSDGNTGARRLYDRFGFAEVATRPMVKEDWLNDGENWVLLRKLLT